MIAAIFLSLVLLFTSLAASLISAIFSVGVCVKNLILFSFDLDLEVKIKVHFSDPRSINKQKLFFKLFFAGSAC